MKLIKFKKPLIIILALALVATFAFKSAKKNKTTASTETITWLDWNAGLAKAKKENKIILIDAYTDWCGWCKVMDKKTYTNAEVIAKINKSFVPVKLNPEKSGTYAVNGKTMTGPQLHRFLGNGRTFGYPTTYFLVNPKAAVKKIYPVVGYIEPGKFKTELNKAIELQKKI